MYFPTAHAIDPIAFVLEADSNNQTVNSNSLGGLMEEDERKAAAAPRIEVPVNAPKTPKNAAGISSSSGLLVVVSSCLLAAVMACWHPAL
jgi:hypothetical protein